MKEPTGDEILVKAMQLAQEDGKPWLWGSNELDNERDERGPFIYRLPADRILKPSPRAAAARGEQRPGRRLSIENRRLPIATA